MKFLNCNYSACMKTLVWMNESFALWRVCLVDFLTYKKRVCLVYSNGWTPQTDNKTVFSDLFILFLALGFPSTCRWIFKKESSQIIDHSSQFPSKNFEFLAIFVFKFPNLNPHFQPKHPWNNPQIALGIFFSHFSLTRFGQEISYLNIGIHGELSHNPNRKNGNGVISYLHVCCSSHGIFSLHLSHFWGHPRDLGQHLLPNPEPGNLWGHSGKRSGHHLSWSAWAFSDINQSNDETRK